MKEKRDHWSDRVTEEIPKMRLALRALSCHSSYKERSGALRNIKRLQESLIQMAIAIKKKKTFSDGIQQYPDEIDKLRVGAIRITDAGGKERPWVFPRCQKCHKRGCRHQTGDTK